MLGRVAVLSALLLVEPPAEGVLAGRPGGPLLLEVQRRHLDITGESVLVRKKFTENFAVEGSYFIDKVGGASIDVLSQASQIKDERKQKTITVEYLHDKTTYTRFIRQQRQARLQVEHQQLPAKQDMFGDLTTLSLAFANTTDVVGENNGTAFVPNVSWLGHAQSRSYDVDLSQILTKNFIAGVNLNVITDQGFLANPYRSVRFIDTGNPKGYSLGSQVYPDTRTSTAVQIEGKYYLPYRAAVTGSYRYFRDTWSIVGNTYELDYTHPISNIWIVEGQFPLLPKAGAMPISTATCFNTPNEYRFEARDKDLAAQDNYTIGAKVTYAFLPDGRYSSARRPHST